jgi:hypothetical protein
MERLLKIVFLIVGVLLVLLGLHGVGHRLLSMATQSSHG